MSASGTNIDRSLELVQKTYNLQATNNISDIPRPSIARVSSHQPSRKSSVHDIHEANKDYLNKVRFFSKYVLNSFLNEFRSLKKFKRIYLV
jgi:hypothetical protein